jgi:AraC family transcriptional regulator of adaptative response / DNA-3-methyladenine glycosylase II
MFDLDSDPLLIAGSFQSHSLLDLLWMKYPGLRVARGWDPYETAVCTILGQLVSLQQAGNLVRQLVQAYGRKISHPADGSEVFLFPAPAVLAAAPLTEVRTTEARKRSIRELSRLVSEGKLDLHTPQDAETMHRSLLAIPGIGPWSAEYIRLRALGDTDAFPATDLILRRALELHRDLRMEKLRPWRSYGAVYLWKHYAASLSKQKKVMK